MLFLAGTLLAANASSMTEILLGRALQGVGEGIISALCYALIPELFPSRLIAKVFGAEAVVWALAAFGGPLLAGLVTDAGGVAAHPAVVSREFGIPAVVGTSSATERISTGDRIRVNGSTGVVEILKGGQDS